MSGGMSHLKCPRPNIFRHGSNPSFDLTNIYASAFEWHLVPYTALSKFTNTAIIIIAWRGKECCHEPKHTHRKLNGDLQRSTVYYGEE